MYQCIDRTCWTAIKPMATEGASTDSQQAGGEDPFRQVDVAGGLPRGRVPPIPQVLDAFVLACGEDPQSWRRYVAAATAGESAVITEADNRDPAVSGARPNGAAPEAAAVTVDVIVADPGVPNRAHGRTARTRAIVLAMSAGVVTIAMVVCAVVFFGTKAPATSPRNLARSNQGVPTWSSPPAGSWPRTGDGIGGWSGQCACGGRAYVSGG